MNLQKVNNKKKYNRNVNLPDDFQLEIQHRFEIQFFQLLKQVQTQTLGETYNNNSHIIFDN